MTSYSTDFTLERNGKIYKARYVIEKKMITVFYGDRQKTTQLGGSANYPGSLARVIAYELIEEEAKNKN